MKKLIITAAIVCAAVLSQASQFQWKASGVLGPGESPTVYSGDAVIHIFAENFVGEEIGAYNGTMTDGVINMTDVGLDSLFTTGTKYSAYYTMETTVAGVDYVFTSGNKTAKALSPQQAVFSFAATGSWAAAPIPEPTSGLLLLLGVAGLALRRRRA